MPTNPPNTNGHPPPPCGDRQTHAPRESGGGASNPPPPCGGGQTDAPRQSGGGASSTPDHPKSTPPQDPTPPLLTLPTDTPTLSPDETQLLEYLLHPEADPGQAASAYGLSLTDLALWLRQPHIQQAHDALRQLHALQRRAWQDQVTKEAVEALRHVMHAAEDPVERRRAAASILRALARTNRTRRPHNQSTDNHPTPPTNNPTNPPSDTTSPNHTTYPTAAAAAESPNTADPAAAAHTPADAHTAAATPPTKPGPHDFDHPDHWCNSPGFQAVYRTLDNIRSRTNTDTDSDSAPNSDTS